MSGLNVKLSFKLLFGSLKNASARAGLAIAVFSSTLFPSLGFAQSPTKSPLEPPSVTETKEHPAGATTIRRWVRPGSHEAYLIEWDRAYSGTPILDKYRVIRQSNGQWVIEIPSTTQTSKQLYRRLYVKQSRRVVIDAQTWQVHMLKQSLPRPAPAGVAQEGLPSIDLRLIRSEAIKR